jgi:predicted RNA-binding Zn ribbon-like protein
MIKDIETMNLDGGCLCLDFINTVHSRMETPVNDYLHSYQDVIRFANHTGILSQKQQQHLLDYAAKHPGKARYAFKKIKTVREELYALFRPITEDKKPAAGIIDHFNKLLSAALSHLHIKPSAGKMQLAWKEEKDPLLLPLWMVIKSAYDVLLNEPPDRIKACPACLWLFLDKTKNNKRRWCNSLSCGSIDKASRYYYRKKEERQ